MLERGTSNLRRSAATTAAAALLFCGEALTQRSLPVVVGSISEGNLDRVC